MVRLSRRCAVTVLCALAVLLALPSPAAAQQGFDGLCTLFLHQQRIELEDLEVTVLEAEEHLRVSEEIFELVDELWRNDLFERLPYLNVKHRRDTARISLERTQRQVDRQRAVIDQYELACSASSRQPASGERGTIEEALQRYIEADCAVRQLEVALFEVDMEYNNGVLLSSRDLRQSDIASRQQVLFAEQDVEVSGYRLEQARQRAARCQQ